MKKYQLVLLSFVPLLVGKLVNSLFLVPVIGMPVFYILPLIAMGFWFWLGGRYARSGWNLAVSLLISHAIGIVSFFIYLWQFLLCTDETRNLWLAGFSQMFCSAAPQYLLARLAILFETENGAMTQNYVTALQVLNLVFMLAVFAVGYLWGRKRSRSGQEKN